MISLGMMLNVIFALLTLFAFVLTVIGIAAYRRTKDKRLGLITLSFFLFFLKGGWLSYRLFTVPEWGMTWLLVAVIDTLILILFYLSSFRR
ncbi:MAG: hypothetical protein ACOCTR_01610 [Candidatus Natronoplasma sp.]